MATRNRNLLFAAIALLLTGAAFADWYHSAPPEALTKATYIGRQSCVSCHQQEHKDWIGSHHDRAMEIASEESVIGDFSDFTFERFGVETRFFRDGDRYMVHTEGPDGQMQDFQVKYTFGIDPLQQYMVEFPDGRVQVLRVSWDTHNKRWFYLPPPDVLDERILPGDPLHWTGVAQNWNTTCAECHSTNLQKNYDFKTNTYATTYSEIDVSCEECHGPGSLHIELANAKSLFWDRHHGYGLAKLKGPDPTAQIEMCAKCHSRRFAVHPGFRPGKPLLDYYDPSVLLETLYHADGQIQDEVYVYGSFLQSKMHAMGVRCTDCHNPHSLELEFPGNQMCAKCHQPAKYDVPAHHHHPLGSKGAECIACHMPATTYMVVDPRHDHSFRIPRPDQTVAVGTPNACNGCHTEPEESPQWAADKVEEWYGPKRHDDPHWAAAIAGGRRADPAALPLLEKLIEKDLGPERPTPAIVRATAVTLLANYNSPGASVTILKALNSSDSLVRLSAARSFNPSRADELAKEIGPLLDDPVRSIRTEAARRLTGVADEWLTSSQRASLEVALQEYNERQIREADHAAGHLSLAAIARQQGNRQRQIKHLRNAIKIEPYLSGARGELATLLGGPDGDPEAVKELWKEEIELLERDADFLPENADIRYRLGLLRFQSGDLAGAEQTLSIASRLAPGNPTYLMTVALLQERRFTLTGDQKHFDSAVGTLRKLDEMTPGNPNAKEILRRLVATRQQMEAGSQQKDPATESSND